MSSKKSRFASIWLEKTSSTTKPSRAIAIAGPSTSASDIVPNSRSATSQVRTVPGTPADSPLQRAAVNGSGAPPSQNESGRIAAGADATGKRLHHAEHCRRGDRRVDRVAARPENVDRSLRGEHIDARGGPARADRDRLLCLGSGGGRARDETDDDEKAQGEASHCPPALWRRRRKWSSAQMSDAAWET